ncbi:MAG TPA: sigma-70 family RNA polymerase sigma factor [Kofleriaceae bacterium]|jgi:RNA polymerase sigma-70 factor (ECF subfamily)|nr:sigma-70 family RNA polymerase sigma factor [Kofleriaceae bacterium]
MTGADLSARCCCSDWIAGLARDHAGRLAAIARREGLTASDALDVVQDAFHTLLGRPDTAALRSRPDDAARLLAAIVRNAARNQRRRHHRARPHVELDPEQLRAPGLRADDALEHVAAAVQLVGCMSQLGDVHRQIVTLRVLEELSGEEAAHALGLTPNHVAVLLHRARKQLERCMQAA